MARIGDKTKHRRSIDRRLREVGEALEILVTVDASWLWEFQRRREMVATPDGIGSGSGDGGSKSADETSSTERAALNRPPGCPHPRPVKLDGLKEPYCAKCGKKMRTHLADPIGAVVEEVFDLLDTATHALRTLERRGAVVLHQADGHRGRQSTIGQCLTCGRTVPGAGADERKGERLRAAYCPACHTAWLRWRKDRTAQGLDVSPVVFRWLRKVERQMAESEMA